MRRSWRLIPEATLRLALALAAGMRQCCDMGRMSAPHSVRVKVAAATGFSPRTIDKYYAGEKVNDSTRQAIEKACFELDFPVRGEKGVRRG